MQVGMETAQHVSVPRHQSPYPANTVSNDETKPATQTAGKPIQSPQGYNAIAVGRDQRILSAGRQDWSPSQATLLQQQQKAALQARQQQSVQSQKSQIPRVDIVPEGSNPFSDVYHEMEKKARVPGSLPITPVEQPAYPVLSNQALSNQSLDPWKNMPTRSEQLTPRAMQQQLQSTSTFYYPTTPASIHSSADANSLNQARRAAPVLPQSQSIVSPTFSQSHTVALSLQGGNYTVQTTLVTLSSTAPVDHTTLISSAKPTETRLAASNVQQQHQWIQSTSNISQHVPTVSTVISPQQQQQQISASNVQRTPNIMYPPQNVTAASATQQQLPYPPQIPTSMKVSTVAQNTTGNRNAVEYPTTNSQSSLTTSIVQTASTNTQYGTTGEQSESKAVQKRKKGSHSSQVSSSSVDFSLLNPEEKRKFILERKREDFERRRRLLEEQRQLKMRDQENQKGLTKKLDKKIPKPKQQRKMKGMREKDAISKSPVSPLLVLEDKSLKLPLCEPEVHLLYPLVQPFGSGYLNGDIIVLGAFGNGTLQGEADYYSQFPSPNPPVTSSNPPTPPSSLPPSPGTINQSLRDSLQMIPTEGIFDDLPTKADMDRTSHLHEQKMEQNADVQKDSKDGVLVTLTMSGNDRRIPDDRVSYVTNMLGVPKPETIQIGDDSKDLPVDDSVHDLPQATSIGSERDVHFSCLDSKKSREDVDNKGPFCKHCDISIHGTGYVECKPDQGSTVNITVDDVSYEKVNVTSSTKVSNAFCSQLCLNSYHSLSKSKVNSSNVQETLADDSGQFIDPVRSVIPVSTGEASSIDYYVSTSESCELRGDLQAPSPGSTLMKRKISAMVNEVFLR